MSMTLTISGKGYQVLWQEKRGMPFQPTIKDHAQHPYNKISKKNIIGLLTMIL